MNRPVAPGESPKHAWHALSTAAVAHELGVDPARGLTSEEAAARRARFGPNAIAEQRSRGPLAMLAAQFTDVMILVLIGAAVIAGIIGEVHDSIAIAVIVILNGVIGFVQEYRAEAAVAALRKIAAPAARVRRDGSAQDIPAANVVPGDVVLLEQGNVVPADLRVIESARLRIEEAALTGESQPVDKTIAALPPDLPLADRRNMAYKGTTAVYGHGIAIVVGTGMATELGRIAALLTGAGEEQTPLQQRLARFGRKLALAVLAICAIVFAAGLLRGEPVVLMFLTAVSLAVAAIPEALPAVVTVALALGARKMVEQRALIRRLPAVETLGSVTYICSDKTGTLTRNRMTVATLFAGGELLTTEDVKARRAEPWGSLFQAMALNNDTSFGPQDQLLGDPTETALYEAARDAGWERRQLAEEWPRIGEVPFDSNRKRMTTLHRHAAASSGENGERIAFVKGAPEAVLPCCSARFVSGAVAPIDRAALLAEAEAQAASGYRVLAFAQRRFPAGVTVPDGDDLEQDLTFLGFAGLIDPPRPEAKDAVAECRSAGITPVMITGDHPATARAIARDIGIVDETGQALTGRELAQLSDAEFAGRVHDTRVYARVDPEQKIRIVQALQAQGEFVAMTGDGVNDAPALKRANIGVAMGQGGTDVAREASHMVLLDDNFATIVAAVREGRRIYDNIRKFIRFVMTGNSGEIWAILLAPFLGLPVPLTPLQILWVNLVTDGLPGLALSVEPAERGIMRRPPRAPEESVFAHGTWQHILWVGLLIGGVSLAAQAWGYRTGSAHWQTMVFTVLAFAQLFHVMAVRSERNSLFTQGVLSNLPLLFAVALSVALQLAIVYLPPLQAVFKTAALTASELALCVGLSFLVFVGVEVEKWLIRRGVIYAAPKTAMR